MILEFQQFLQDDTNQTEFDDMPTFEFYELENHFFANYYIYATLFCQGSVYMAYCLASLTDYRKWNILGSYKLNNFYINPEKKFIPVIVLRVHLVALRAG